MTAFDRAWTFLKYDTGDSHNSYIPLDEKGEPLSMEPMSWGSAKMVLDSYEGETGIPYDALNQIVPFEGGLADMILDSGEMEPPEPDNSVSEGPDWRDER